MTEEKLLTEPATDQIAQKVMIIPAKKLYQVVAIVLVILAVAALLGIGTALLYVEYLEASR